MRIEIDTNQPLSEADRLVLMALLGDIRLDEPNKKVPEPVVFDEPSKGGPEEIQEAEPAPDAEETAPVAKSEEPKPRARVVNVSEESLKKYDFHVADDGAITCDHCEFVSETGRALHLHAGTHKDEEAPKATLKSVPEPEPEAGVDAFLSTEGAPTEEDGDDPNHDNHPEPVSPDPQPEDVEDAEKAAAGDPVEAKVVDPKELRDAVAKVATEMVAKGMQAQIRPVLDDLGVARVSMIAEGDLQKFLSAEPIAAFIAKQAG